MKWEEEQLIAIHAALARIEERLVATDNKVEDTRNYAQDISRRVRSLEVSRGWFVGAGAAAGGAMAWLTKFLT